MGQEPRIQNPPPRETLNLTCLGIPQLDTEEALPIVLEHAPCKANTQTKRYSK